MSVLWLRAVIFTVLVPVIVGGIIPWRLPRSGPPPEGAVPVGGALILGGVFLYLTCLSRFVSAGGTPAMFFLRPLRALVGQEPGKVVRHGAYHYSRNPMYLAVIAVILGQALFWWSGPAALYGLAMFVVFTLVIVFVEEPHLKKRFGKHYEDYAMRVPRWF